MATLFDSEYTSLQAVREDAADCRRCHLWERATQTVFGEGSPKSEIVFVGEVPGDQEDKVGRPFVGPAGQLLDEALEQAGIDRKLAYVTNVVKHFKWQARGKRRIHQKPNVAEIGACRIWLDAELSLLQPKVLVCLGAVAAQALLGRQFRVSRDRGVPIESDLASGRHGDCAPVVDPPLGRPRDGDDALRGRSSSGGEGLSSPLSRSATTAASTSTTSHVTLTVGWSMFGSLKPAQPRLTTCSFQSSCAATPRP